jgi:hypothetical protein
MGHRAKQLYPPSHILRKLIRITIYVWPLDLARQSKQEKEAHITFFYKRSLSIRIFSGVKTKVQLKAQQPRFGLCKTFRNVLETHANLVFGNHLIYSPPPPPVTFLAGSKDLLIALWK